MSEEIKKGSICVTDSGDAIVVSRVDVQAEDTDSYGRVHVFHVGTCLRSSNVPVGSRFNGKTVRVVLHAGELLRLAESAGYDLSTPAEKPESELTEVQLLKRRLAQLEQTVKQTSSSEHVVARPQTGIATLQK